MLPLINNVLSSSPSPSNSSTAGAFSLASATTDGSAASRQQLSTAVTATPAPTAYYSGTHAQTGGVSPTYTPSTGDIQLPEATAQQLQQTQAQQSQPQRSVPVTLGIPLTTQLTAQFIAQQPAIATLATASQGETIDSGTDDGSLPVPAPLTRATSHFSTARGASAYDFAASTATATAQPDIESA